MNQIIKYLRAKDAGATTADANLMCDAADALERAYGLLSIVSREVNAGGLSEETAHAVDLAVQGHTPAHREQQMKPYIVLVGSAYEGSGWDDYAGSADTIEEAEGIVQCKVAEQGWLCRESYYFHIVDLRTMKIVKRG